MDPIAPQRSDAPPADPCVMVIFGASGDLTRRLLVPALYNLAFDGLLPSKFAIIGTSRSEMSAGEFSAHLTDSLQQFNTHGELNEGVWAPIAERIDYVAGEFDDPATYTNIAERIARLDAELGGGGNVLFYLATPPVVFSMIAGHIAQAGLARNEKGWRRLVVEKPFGHDLDSARALNAALLEHWREEQIFRIDHYLGKETVQNLLAFRFANGIFEPLWNKQHICDIQFTVSESVTVEGRGRYYDKAGVVRDMIQNHMFQMLAYLCMEPPSSFEADAIRNEKAKVLEAVRIMSPGDVLQDTVRGQYGAGNRPSGEAVHGYREDPDVDDSSSTETFAALKLHIDNWRWEGVPIYLRSGKALWKRGTEIIVEFKKAPEVLFRKTSTVDTLERNQLVFHIQPDQAIEIRFQAKRPGPTLSMQEVDMRFDYHESFEAARATGYEVLLYQCMRGDATLFTRNDLVEAAWGIAQPILDAWAENPAEDFPNYTAGSWGPKAAYDLLQRDGRRWVEIINRDMLEAVPLFQNTSPVFLHSLAMVLTPAVYDAGDVIVQKGDIGREMYFLARGQVDVVDDHQLLSRLGEGSYFGEKSLLLSEPRSAWVIAKTHCDVYVLDKAMFQKVLRDHPRFARSILDACRERYELVVDAAEAFDSLLARYVREGDDDSD